MNQHQKKKKPNNNRSRNNRYRNKRRTSSKVKYKFTEFESLMSKYLNLQVLLIEARKQYYSLFDRAQKSQKDKLERKFYQALNNLRDFENKVPEKLKDQFFARINGKKIDTDYSSSHGLTTDGQVESSIEISPPHLLLSQKESNFKSDNEESVGTMDDYEKYKESR